MTVWQLTLSLLRHVIHGRTRCRAYVVINGLSDTAQAEINERNLIVTYTWAPYTRQDRFVGIAAEREQDAQ